jgi:hypothetical protein
MLYDILYIQMICIPQVKMVDIKRVPILTTLLNDTLKLKNLRRSHLM